MPIPTPLLLKSVYYFLEISLPLLGVMETTYETLVFEKKILEMRETKTQIYIDVFC